MTSERSHKLKWIFRGNFVVPTGNPFFCEAQMPDGADFQWLGPGLKLLIDHILTVDDHGIIAHLNSAKSFQLDPSKAFGFAPYASEDATMIELSPREILCPGMIDLHIHAPQYAYAGTATDRPLMGPDGWLETYTFPAERRLGSDLKLAKQVYEGVVKTTLQTGTTTAVYFATLHVEPCKVLVDTALKFGQRALVGKVCMDRYSPNDYCQSLSQNIQETETLLDYISEHSGKRKALEPLPLVLPLITPRFIPTCSPDLLSELGKLAKKYQCHVTSHISESVDEVAFSRHLDATEDLKDGVGRTDASIFDSHGLLTDQCIMAHGVHLSEQDLDLMRDRGSAVAHCPLSNFFFAGGSLPCRKLLERGNQRVGLGTDVAGGYSPSMLHSSRMVVVASQALQHQTIANNEDANHILDYRHAFYLATLGGAEALGLQDRVGTLSIGMEFDAIILSADVDSPVQIFDSDRITDVFQKLCVLADDRNVKRVFVQGRDVTKS